MRILYLSDQYPYPLTSGHLRHYYFIRELAQEHAVTLLSMAQQPPGEKERAALEPCLARLEIVPRVKRRSLWQKGVRRMQQLAGADAASRTLRATAMRLLAEERYDALVLSGKETWSLARHARDLPPLVTDICDAASVRVKGRIPHTTLLQRPALLAGHAYLRHVERQLIRYSQRLVFAAQRDRDALMSDDNRRAVVIPNGVDLDYWTRSTEKLGRHTLIFTGAMSYPPNVDAALWLIQSIFPAVRRAVPDARLLIVGRDPRPELVAAGKTPGVTVTGFVEDMRPYLDESTLFVAPLRFGAGIQNKLLEAMAMQLPVIASPLAADGLRTDADEPPLVIAESADALVTQILQQFELRDADPAPCTAGREYVSQHFRWQHAGERLRRVLAEIAPRTAAHEVLACSP